jgi:chromosome segregation ATPase
MGRTKKKARQMEVRNHWGQSETEESHSSSNRVGAGEVSEQEDRSSNDYKFVPTNGGRPQKKEVSSAQRAHNPTLAPWAQAISEATEKLGIANRAISDLQGKFKLHMDDLRTMDETINRLKQLESSGRVKDEEITRLNHTITTLREMDGKTKAMADQKMAEIEKKKEELDQDKAKQEKRFTATIAEEKLKFQTELQKFTEEQSQTYKKRRADLEDEFSQKTKANDKTITELANEKKQLQKALEEQKKAMEEQRTTMKIELEERNTAMKFQSKKLDEYIDQCDLLRRAKDSFKSDKLAREKELEMMKEEFALNSKPKDYLYAF